MNGIENSLKFVSFYNNGHIVEENINSIINTASVAYIDDPLLKGDGSLDNPLSISINLSEDNFCKLTDTGIKATQSWRRDNSSVSYGDAGNLNSIDNTATMVAPYTITYNDITKLASTYLYSDFCFLNKENICLPVAQINTINYKNKYSGSVDTIDIYYYSLENPDSTDIHLKYPNDGYNRFQLFIDSFNLYKD
ncbi:hypothetical protein [Xenorhabdus entomophaga]|uniref:hypothetical protein n=1 Tax=Xenorhabdus entomophaga TaxID=3136257 RepID=UPI0030F402E3